MTAKTTDRELLVLARQRQLSLERLAHFVRFAWPWTESKPLVWGRHLAVVCDALQDAAEAPSSSLVVAMPPRHGKSLLASVFLPAWVWARQPGTRSLYCSHSARLAMRDSRRTRRLVGSQWYQTLFCHDWSIQQREDRSADFANSSGGARFCAGVGAGLTGFGGDLVVIDDAIDARKAWSDPVREEAIDWYRESLSTRFDDLSARRIIVVGHRVHDGDLTGHILRTETGWRVLRLPAEYEPARACPEDWRTEPGELLWPERVGHDELDLQRQILGAGYSAQYQQEPVDPASQLFPRRGWRFWAPEERPAGWRARRPVGCDNSPAMPIDPHALPLQVLSCDLAFTDADDSSYVVLQAWGLRGGDRFLLEQVRQRLTFVETIRHLREMATRWPGARKKLVEKAANGHAVANALERVLSGIELVQPLGKKVARAQACTPEVQSGNVFLPEGAEWVDAYVSELERFPQGEHDDQVDASSQAMNFLAGRGDVVERWRARLA